MHAYFFYISFFGLMLVCVHVANSLMGVMSVILLLNNMEN